MLDLEGKRIALVPTDSHGKAFLDLLVRFNIKAQIIQADSYKSALQQVLSGQADACIISRIYPLSSAETTQVHQTPVIFNPVQNKYAAIKNKQLDVLHALDKSLAALKADEHSFYYRTIEKWLGVPGSRAIPVWIWWFMGGGTLVFGAALIYWRYRSVVTLSNELAASRHDLRTVFDNTDKGIIIHDQRGRILAVNHPATVLYGADQAQLLTLPVLDLSAETVDRHTKLPEIMQTVLDGQTLKFEWLCRNLTTAEIFEAEVFYTGITWNGEPVLMAMVHDITQIKQREALIKRLTIAVEQSANTIVITGIDGVIHYANPSFERMTGYTVAEAIGSDPSLLKSGYHHPSYYQKLWKTLSAGEIWHGDFCNKRKDGTLFWESTTITPVKQDNQEITHFVAIKEDITQRKEQERTLYRQAHYDELTSLPNRNLLTQKVMTAIANQTPGCEQLVLMLLDLDNFKMINDTLGHSTGDKLLSKVAERLAGCVVPGDTVARLGGDEFAIMPKKRSDEEFCPERLAEQIMASFTEPFTLQGQEVFITASMGIACYPEDGDSMETLLRNADAAMYHAKQKGRNLYECYQRGLSSRIRDRLAMETRLRRALERQEFLVYYQPQQDLATGVVVAFEALLRWKPEGGALIAPVDFIPVLEETGLIIQVGEWVLHEVCNQVKQWNDAGMTLRHASVNVSFRQFQRPDIVKRLLSIIRDSGVNPSCICLELTESIMMEDPEGTLHKLNELQAAGVSLSIDDFGTGYSSLAYLRRMPLNELKIDRSFIMTLPESNASLVTTILVMARSLGLRVVAEGVETAGQREYLQQHGCESMQGYLLSPPVPAAQFASIISNSGCIILPAPAEQTTAEGTEPAV
ncbi:MAG: EAL domain-containing protein [Geobacter sp.]|nr:EAL domain-containing protein [Geobacter sp.]